MLSWVLLGAALLALGLAIVALRRRRARQRGLERQVTRLAAQLDRRLTELFSLQELTYVLANALDLDGIAAQAAGFLGRFVDTDAVLIALKEEGDESIVIAAAHGALAGLAGQVVTEEETGLIGVAIARNRLELVNAATKPSPPLVLQHRSDCAAVAPLSAHGAAVGAIAIARHDPTFDQEEVRLLSSVATHTAIALSNARFVELIRLGKSQWETTFDAIADGIAVVDELGRIHRANKALARLIGVPIAEVIGRRLVDAWQGPSPDVAGYLDEIRSGTRRRPVTIRHPDSGALLQVSAYPMPGETAGWLVTVVEDVTERKRLESQLIQSEKMAAVGQLVSGVAHELNNPLTSISGLSEFLMQQAAEGPRRDHLHVIHEQAERAARIVQNLLTFARKGPASVEAVDVTDVVQRVASLMSYELRLRKVDLELDVAPSLPAVEGDRYQLQQVLLNLVTNALQAVAQNPPDRQRKVRIRAASAGPTVRVTIEDSGPGIPEDEVPHIFDPFFTTKAPGEGTGLGLSLSFQIVQGHGGEITVRRSPLGGALFELSLPASHARAVQAPASRASPAPAVRGRRVLLVDDDPAVRRAISVLFATEGTDVVAVPSAAEALQHLAREPYDAILGDPRAAVSATETLADALAARPELKDRTIFLTADVRRETDEWLNRLGFQFFRKPFNVRDVQGALQRIFNRS